MRYDISFCSNFECNNKDCKLNFINRPRKGNRHYVVSDYYKDKKVCANLKEIKNAKTV